MSLREYLYVDGRRLDAYLDQIGPPITYDKVPVWHAEIALTGPKAAATQERRARVLTLHEKVEALLKHLTHEGLIYDGRPVYSSGNRDRDLQFAVETCSAVRVQIPARLRSGDNTKTLSLWVASPVNEGQTPSGKSSEADRAGLLCLLEDFNYSDETPFDGHSVSAYSLLWSIIWSLREQMSKVVLGDTFPTVDDQVSDDSLENRLKVWTGSSHGNLAFVRDPVGSLQAWGCIPGRLRKIRTLYRIREFGPEILATSSISIFGYPIVIMDARS
jgi:hypothetical protein